MKEAKKLVGRTLVKKETLEQYVRNSVTMTDFYGEKYNYDEMMNVFDSLFGNGEHIENDIDTFNPATIWENGKEAGFITFNPNEGWVIGEFQYASLTQLMSILEERYNLVESYNRKMQI